MRVWSVVAVFVGILVCLGGFGLAVYAASGVNGGNMLLMWAGFGVMAAAFVGIWYAQVLVGRDGKAAFLRAANGDFRADQSQWFSGSGLAYNRSAGRLLLADRGISKVYDVTRVQSLIVKLQLTHGVPGSTHAVSALINLVLLPQMIRQAVENGLYVVVDDAAKPRWHIRGIDGRAAEEWVALIEGEKARRLAAA